MKLEPTEAQRRNGWLGGENQDVGGRQRETRWLTPPELFKPLGTFDLDPCGAPGHKIAEATYLLEEGNDGLTDLWFGRVWLNPPYGPSQKPFMRRMVDHHNGTALIFARTETKLFSETVWEAATAILFLKGRVTFLDSSGKPAKANSGAPSCLVAYGPRDAEALYSSGLPGFYIKLREA